MIGLLIAVSVLLLVVTALGIVGLASFWVQQRQADRHPPRARRHPRPDPALLPDRELPAGHARHRARHAAGLRHQPVADGQYELPRLPWYYLPWRAALWGLGQSPCSGRPARRCGAARRGHAHGLMFLPARPLMMRDAALALPVRSVRPGHRAALPQDAPDLQATIAGLDAALFDAFNRCADPAQRFACRVLDPAVEFYHDTGGVTWNREDMLANTAARLRPLHPAARARQSAGTR
jgi:hypothetical protein